MNIWLDDYDSIRVELCAMAPYADEELQTVAYINSEGTAWFTDLKANESRD